MTDRIEQIGKRLQALAQGDVLQSVMGEDLSTREALWQARKDLDTQMQALFPPTFREFMLIEFADAEFADLAYGIDGGFRWFTWTDDIRQLYATYQDDLWREFAEYNEDSGHTTDSQLAGLMRDQELDAATIETRLVWFVGELVASQFADRINEGEDIRE